MKGFSVSVSLNSTALSALRELKKQAKSEWVFVSREMGSHLSLSGQPLKRSVDMLISRALHRTFCGIHLRQGWQ